RVFPFLFRAGAFRTLPAARSPPARSMVVLRSRAARRAAALDTEHSRRPRKSVEGAGRLGFQARPLSRHLGRRGGRLFQRVALEAARLRAAGGSGDPPPVRAALPGPVGTLAPRAGLRLRRERPCLDAPCRRASGSERAA